MSNALVVSNTSVLGMGTDIALPPVPWRDPHTVSPVELSTYIKSLEQACLDNPRSADLRTCLGMAYAVNFDVDKSMEALEAATSIDPENFWAQFKYAELQYRLRTLANAEEAALKATELAQNQWHYNLARKQLQEIRRLRREGVRDVSWNKSLVAPTVFLSAMLLVIFVVMSWK
jgi:tetratricopeptide (TPR) repeat protein